MTHTGLVTGCATAPNPPFPGKPTESVYLIAAGWHTEVGLQTDALGPPLAALAAQFPGATVLTFGFGDRAWVLAKHDGIAEALGALLPNPGLILVTALKASPQAAFGQERVVVLHVSPHGFAHIGAFIWDSLASDGGRLERAYGPGPYAGSVFYASRIPYDGFYTCNTWTAEALGAGGLPIQAKGILFASEAMREARRAAAR